MISTSAVLLRRLTLFDDTLKNLRSGLDKGPIIGSLKAILSLKVVDQDGKESYTIAQSPNIILPPSALTELGVKIKGR